MSEENVNTEGTATEIPASTVIKEEVKVNLWSSFLELKKDNTNMFYGLVGGVSVIILTLLVLGFGGSDEVLKKADSKSLAAGQKYTLKSPNAATDGGEALTVRLVSVPGAIAAFDDDENKEECRKFPVGTNVTVLDKQEMSNIIYAKVQIDGDVCNGTIGWVLGINL